MTDPRPPPEKCLTPTPGKKRGRVLRTDSGKEISHEEVLVGLIKRTAVTLAAAGQCACGAAIERPRKGPMPARCLVCNTEKRRAAQREYERRRGCAHTKQRMSGYKSLSATISAASKRAETKRRIAAEQREKRRVAGLCQLCGKAPATSRCEDCKAKRAAAKQVKRAA